MERVDNKYNTKEKIFQRAQEVIGIPLKDIDKTGRLRTGKGAIGSILEESWFGYKINSDSNADFKEAGVELKVTPYIISKKGIKAKERLVCNIINYIEEYKNSFYTSSFWKNCNKMLLISYKQKKDVPKGNFTIDKATLFSFPEEDLLIIKNDWEKIINKVRAGKAHELSEGDTMYLGACTKGASAKSVREQPFSEIKAKQRAYSLKQSYMTYILNTYIFGNQTDEHIITNINDLKDNSFEDYIVSKIKPYIGYTQEQLLNEFALQPNAKNVFEIAVARMLGVKCHLSATEEFKKAGIIPKTIRVQRTGKIKESMSFPAFDFIELSKEQWENSTLKNYLEPTKFMFVIFKENDKYEYVFDRIKFWNIPQDDLEEVHKVWQKTVDIINEGVVLTCVGKRIRNNLPKSSENKVAHVRPHGKNSKDTLPLPDGRKMTKQCFWLNSTYIEKQIK